MISVIRVTEPLAAGAETIRAGAIGLWNTHSEDVRFSRNDVDVPIGAVPVYDAAILQDLVYEVLFHIDNISITLPKSPE